MHGYPAKRQGGIKRKFVRWRVNDVDLQRGGDEPNSLNGGNQPLCPTTDPIPIPTSPLLSFPFLSSPSIPFLDGLGCKA